MRREEILKARAKENQIRKPESVPHLVGEQISDKERRANTTDHILANQADVSHDTVHRVRLSGAI